MKEYCVYILRCSDDTYYTGITNDLHRRLNEHQTGHDPGSYVSSRLPVQLVYNHWFDDVLQAIAWEKRVKDWSGRKKEALIHGKFEILPELSQCRNETCHTNISSRLRSN